MRKVTPIGFGLLLLSLFTTSLVAQPAAAPTATPAAPDASLNARMMQMRLLMEELWITSANPRTLTQPTGSAIFKTQLQQFIVLAKGLVKPHAKMRSDQGQAIDPSTQLVATLFAEEAERALTAANRNDLGFARSQVLNLSGYCMTCHTATNQGPQFSQGRLSEELRGLSELERADFLAATRNFDQALETYGQIVQNPKAFGDGDWMQAIRKILLITVRFKEDPKLALKWLRPTLKRGKMAFYFRKDLESWVAALDEWRIKPIVLPQDDQAALQLIRERFTAAVQNKKYPADRSTEVEFLRVTAMGHSLARRSPESKLVAEVFLLLGHAYRALDDLNLWPLHEVYFESCVRRAPHSRLAQQCYEALEESIHLESTGSAGTFVPNELTVKLRELAKIAK